MTNRGNINTDEVRTDNKQGDGPLLQTAASAYTFGNLVASGSDGRLVDSGVAGASLSGGGITVNGSPTISVNSNPVSYNDTVTVNGVAI
jgi:hypothetical protein